MIPLMLFTEVRLAPAAACRAWTAAHGCFTAIEWEGELDHLPALRFLFERARLRISETLSVEGIDPLGIVRQLLVHESAASLSRAELHDVGFAHLDAPSGIHLYALWRAYEFGMARLVSRFGLGPRIASLLRSVPPLVLWFVVFALAGFRPGLIRPLVLVGVRWCAARFGFRLARWAPIVLALLFDAVLSGWSSGTVHYALAWWGGVLGYEWARSRGYGSLKAHLALATAAWIAVLPLDLIDGRFAPATPLLSLLTIEFLVRGGYLAFFAAALGVAFGTDPRFSEALEWGSGLVNRGVANLNGFLVHAGFMRSIPDAYGGPLALGMGFAVCVFSLFCLPRSFRGRLETH
jgi:hypothetical protein